MRKRIAPRLTNGFFVWPDAGAVKFSGKPMVQKARRELKALLAVVNSVKWVGTDPDLFDMPSVNDMRRIVRALARLDRVSKEGGAKGEP